MNLLDKARQDRLAQIEEHLRLSGCGKCKICNTWVDKSYIKNDVCDDHSQNKIEINWANLR